MTRYEIDCHKCKNIIKIGCDYYCNPMKEGKKACYVETHTGTKSDPDIIKCSFFIPDSEPYIQLEFGGYYND